MVNSRVVFSTRRRVLYTWISAGRKVSPGKKKRRKEQRSLRKSRKSRKTSKTGNKWQRILDFAVCASF